MVLEHLDWRQDAFYEFFRILKAAIFLQKLVDFLGRWKQDVLNHPMGTIQTGLQFSAYALHGYDHSHAFTWAYLTVFRKPPTVNG